MAVFFACPALSSTSRGSPFVTAHQTLQCRLWMPTAFLSKIPHLLLAVADAKMTLCEDDVETNEEEGDSVADDAEDDVVGDETFLQ
eukprot:4582829-Pleurochrysis_carterae.AAC.1